MMLCPKSVTIAALKRSNRCMGTLVATEEFPSSIYLTPRISSLGTVQESVLPNGIKILSRDNAKPVVSVKFSIASGSRAESLEEKGAAQLLAATAFIGTAKRSGIRLVRDLENLGAKFSAVADREQITYEVKALADNALEAVSIVSEAIVSAPSAPYVIKEAKSSAQPAYDAMSNLPEVKLEELLHEAAFGENTPLGSSFLSSSLDQVDENAMISFRSANFKTGNFVISADGLSHSSLKELVECQFHGLPTGSTSQVASPFVGGDIRVKADLGGVSYIGLAFPVPQSQQVVYKVLYETISSKLKAKKFPSGAVTPFLKSYSSGGIFGFYANGTPAAASSYLQAIVAEMKEISVKANIDAAKTKATLESAISMEGSDYLSCVDLKSVTAPAVSAAATAALKSTPAYAVLGTTYGAPTSASKILS